MLRLAALLAERLGDGVQAFFCNSGAEANEAALKVARKATGRARIVALEGGFHGRTLGSLSVTGQPAKWEGFGPLVPGVSFARPNDVESLEAAVAPGGELAAIVLEPILGEGGVVPLEDEFVHAPRARSRARSGRCSGSTRCRPGLGRTGTFFAYEQLGLEPDLVTLAKGLGNGLPIGALLVRGERARQAIGPGDHGSTFGGNPVAAAAACAVVEAIDAELLAAGRRQARRQLADGLARAPGRAGGARPRPDARGRARPRRRPGRRRRAGRGAARPHRRPRRPSADCRRSSSRTRRSRRRSRSSTRRCGEQPRAAGRDPAARPRQRDLDPGRARRRPPRRGPRRRADDGLARRPRARARQGAGAVRAARLRGARQRRRRPAARDRRRDAPLRDRRRARRRRSSSSRRPRGTRARSPRRSTRAPTPGSRGRSPATTRSSSPPARARPPRRSATSSASSSSRASAQARPARGATLEANPSNEGARNGAGGRSP